MSEVHSTDGSSRVRGSRFFREPSHRWWYVLGFALSIGAFCYGLVATPPNPQTTNPKLHTLRWLCIGVGMLLSSTAEFLPRDGITPAGRLRIAGYALFWSSWACSCLTWSSTPCYPATSRCRPKRSNGPVRADRGVDFRRSRHRRTHLRRERHDGAPGPAAGDATLDRGILRLRRCRPRTTHRQGDEPCLTLEGILFNELRASRPLDTGVDPDLGRDIEATRGDPFCHPKPAPPPTSSAASGANIRPPPRTLPSTTASTASWSSTTTTRFALPRGRSRTTSPSAWSGAARCWKPTRRRATFS